MFDWPPKTYPSKYRDINLNIKYIDTCIWKKCNVLLVYFYKNNIKLEEKNIVMLVFKIIVNFANNKLASHFVGV